MGQLSVATPHYLNRNGSTEIEAPIPSVTLDYDAEALRIALEARGDPVNVASLTSGLGVIAVLPDQLLGGADRRRDGNGRRPGARPPRGRTPAPAIDRRPRRGPDDSGRA